MKTIRFIIFSLVMTLMAVSCIEDGVSTSPSDQPAFSVDTLDMGVSFAGQPTPTYKFMVYNRHSKIMNLSDVRVRGDGGEVFRLNVDGSSGREFSNIEIRPNDSIYVMVEATVPRPDGMESNTVTGHVDVVVNGVSSSVVLRATGRNVEVVEAMVVDRDTRWTAGVPYQVFDSLVVAEGATLTLGAGVELLFHAGARLDVRGTLVCEGSPEAPVVMTGDRLDNVVADIPFDLMASQWDGLTFHRTSRANRLSHTVVKNMTTGIFVDSVKAEGTVPGLTVVNSRLRNSAGYCLGSYFSDIAVYGTEIADAALTPLLAIGGNIDMAYCTVANYYLFAPIAYPLVNLSHFNDVSDQGVDAPYMKARFADCIFYGLGQDMNAGNFDGTDVYIFRTLFKSEGTDDDHFVGCLWAVDPLYYTVRDDYVFDYRLMPGSPAIGAGDAADIPGDCAVDFYGVARGATPSLGAFEYTEPAQQ